MKSSYCKNVQYTRVRHDRTAGGVDGDGHHSRILNHEEHPNPALLNLTLTFSTMTDPLVTCIKFCHVNKTSCRGHNWDVKKIFGWHVCPNEHSVRSARFVSNTSGDSKRKSHKVQN